MAGRLIGIVAASVALVATAAGSPEVPTAYALIPAQLSAARAFPPNAPAARTRKATPAKTGEDLTPDEYKRLADAMNRMTPKERKRLAKAIKSLSPEGRRQFAQVVKRQLAGQATSSQVVKRGR
jgi:hypothetical protein